MLINFHLTSKESRAQSNLFSNSISAALMDRCTSNNWKDSIVKGGEASPTLDKLEIYHDGPQTVLDSSHVDLFPILLRC
jgi:hypothetical protein